MSTPEKATSPVRTDTEKGTADTGQQIAPYAQRLKTVLPQDDEHSDDMFSELSCADGSLPLRTPRRAVRRRDGGQYFFTIEGLESVAEGTGTDDRQAKDNFLFQFNHLFHFIRQKLDPFRTSEEREQWKQLCDVIDIGAYNEQRLVSSGPEFGKIIEKREGSCLIEWHDGEQIWVSLEHRQAPEDFFHLECDQWFEANVERRYLDGSLYRMVDFEKTEQPPTLSEEELEEIWPSRKKGTTPDA